MLGVLLKLVGKTSKKFKVLQQNFKVILAAVLRTTSYDKVSGQPPVVLRCRCYLELLLRPHVCFNGTKKVWSIKQKKIKSQATL